jgi:hypothetical protein
MEFDADLPDTLLVAKKLWVSENYRADVTIKETTATLERGNC